MYVIGIDPDSDKHGFAFYERGKLKDLGMWNNIDILDFLKEYPEANHRLLFSIEDVCANNFVYARNESKNPQIMAKIGLSIGRCQQAQTELVRLLDFYDIKYVLHKPQKGNWAKNKKQFELATGWKGQSNEDTRSAAYFGYLGLKEKAPAC